MMMLVWGVAGLAALLLLLGGLRIAFIALFPRRLVFRPERAVPDPADVGVGELARVRFTAADGVRLSAWYRRPEDNDTPVLLYLHGNAGNVASVAPKARPYLDLGFGVLLLDYRGYGESEGRPSEKGLYRDARAALHFLASEGIEERRCVIYGESLGGAVAVELARGAEVAALVLEAPVASVIAIARSRYPFLPVTRLLPDHFEAIKRIAEVRAPLLIMHGGGDTTVPIEHGKRLFAAANKPKEMYYHSEAGHTDIFDYLETHLVIDFLRRHGGLAAPRPRERMLEKQ
jgi:fermentation-respiration switch protein FrsA (DUF1100 family)